jgi:ATP-binding cassette subfamily B protein
MDASAAVLGALVPRGWLVAGVAGLAPAFVAGAASPAALAVGLGGVVLAHRALRRLVAGLAELTGAAIAWGQVAPLYHAAERAEVRGTPSVALATGGDGRALLEAHDLTFRYRDRGGAVLRGASLRVRRRERILLEGPSGAGKSTLVSLLDGLRSPESGLILLHGLDRQSLGSDAWRQRVVAAPQFHENHVLSASFAFNLLMGRPWPARSEEWRELEAVCAELGLGDLVARMPAGLLQMVGETGWQLSHGERSRLYIARALLQGAELVVLDESFAALDPENLERALRCALRRAPTLLVVAHP